MKLNFKIIRKWMLDDYMFSDVRLVSYSMNFSSNIKIIAIVLDFRLKTRAQLHSDRLGCAFQSKRLQFHYFDVDIDFVDATRVVNGADCVQLHMASNIRTITVCARVNILPRLNPFIMEFPSESDKLEEKLRNQSIDQIYSLHK